jgi:predicted ATPase
LLSTFPPPLQGAIGRDACVAELAQVVNERRVVTVVGAAGAGKTTLAVLVAHAIDTFDGSMFFVDLSNVDRADMVRKRWLRLLATCRQEETFFRGSSMPFQQTGH